MGWELGFLSTLADGQNLTQKGWSEGYFPYQRKLQKTKTLLAILIRKRYNWGIAYTKLMGRLEGQALGRPPEMPCRSWMLNGPGEALPSWQSKGREIKKSPLEWSSSSIRNCSYDPGSHYHYSCSCPCTPSRPATRFCNSELDFCCHCNCFLTSVKLPPGPRNITACRKLNTPQSSSAAIDKSNRKMNSTSYLSRLDLIVAISRSQMQGILGNVIFNPASVVQKAMPEGHQNGY